MSPMFTLPPRTTFFLASASPRRYELLRTSWGIDITKIAQDVPEAEPAPHVSAKNYTLALAETKAKAALPHIPKNNKSAIVLAADTVVALNDKIFGKPKDAEEAHSMLTQLAGKTHAVTTSAVLLLEYETVRISQTSTVTFGDFSTDVLWAYVRTQEPMDKAGSYAIQGIGAFLVKEIKGSWTTIVGLPLEALTQELLSRNILLPM